MVALWRGRLPLAQAFWVHAILHVTVLNTLATLGALGMLAADLSVALAAVVFFLPLPYIVVAVVGVWRSADAYRGPPYWATLARIVAAVWGGLMVLA